MKRELGILAALVGVFAFAYFVPLLLGLLRVPPPVPIGN